MSASRNEEGEKHGRRSGSIDGEENDAVKGEIRTSSCRRRIVVICESLSLSSSSHSLPRIRPDRRFRRDETKRDETEQG